MKKLYKGLIDGQEIYFMPKRDPKWMKEIVTGITFRTNKVDYLVIINRDSSYYQDEIIKYITSKTDNYNAFFDFLMSYKNREDIATNYSPKRKKPLKVQIKILKRSRFTGEIKSCKVIDNDREGE